MPEAVEDRQRLSAIAHATSLMWGPISQDTADGLLARLGSLGISESSRVLDLGCGPAELLRRVCEATGASGIGVDSSPFAIEEARRRLATSPVRDRVELRIGDATVLTPDGTNDLVICIGPGWTTGGWVPMTRWTSAFVRPGGLLLLGEAAWRGVPREDSLATLEMTSDEHILGADVGRSVSEAGAKVAWSHRSSLDEWGAYADAYRSAMRHFVLDHPDDPITPAVCSRSEAGWVHYELLHELLDFVIVLAQRASRA
ncbi:methyltransferase domain-containing protein [soil metagenome]